ncbi:hypothetical protein [Sulfitobacter sp. W074]|uniref:hypothetical protein n=1 Tax=Sulfitobacter sp. W074 TaxID=2867026 RepID=UPI0021A82BD6|nr:hypothetical protein [Sulfitobacter sp. W074]UWR38369.1 hypothetical protein K3762_04880 [Sulfitobacter sp. W074]
MIELIKITQTKTTWPGEVRKRLSLATNRLTAPQDMKREASRLNSNQDEWRDIYAVHINGAEVDWIYFHQGGARAAFEHYAPGRWMDDTVNRGISEIILEVIASLVSYDRDKIDSQISSPSLAIRTRVLNKLREMPEVFDMDQGALFWNGTRINPARIAA